MALKTTLYDPAEYLTSSASVYYFVEAELEMNEPSYWPGTIAIVAKARGGFARLAEETGIPASLLEAASMESAAPDRALMEQLMEAYRPASETAGRVA